MNSTRTYRNLSMWQQDVFQLQGTWCFFSDSKSVQCLESKPVGGRKWVYLCNRNIFSTSYPVIADSEVDNFLWLMFHMPAFIYVSVLARS